jgi:predicted methyltransferase
MPSMVRSMMAMPAMKKRSYKIGVDEAGNVSAGLQRQPDQVTVIDLDQFVVQAVHFAADEKSLKALVAQ